MASNTQQTRRSQRQLDPPPKTIKNNGTFTYILVIYFIYIDLIYGKYAKNINLHTQKQDRVMVIVLWHFLPLQSAIILSLKSLPLFLIELFSGKNTVIPRGNNYKSRKSRLKCIRQCIFSHSNLCTSQVSSHYLN